jgi:hypothetical protein
MRRLSFILLVSVLALPAAAFAARADKGDGVFELKAGSGTFTLSGRGVLLAQVGKGIVRVQDMTPNDGQQPAVSGADHTHPTDDPNVTLYIGSTIHVRVTGGKYKIRFKGSGINLTAIGVGNADIVASPTAFDTGNFSLDGGKWVSVPFGEKVIPYGAQPIAPTTGP